jgi:hypothetical protein
MPPSCGPLTTPVTILDLDPDADPPKVLAIGPDRAGNVLEVIWLELAEDANLVIHAMPLRRPSTTCSRKPGGTCRDGTDHASHP